MNKNKYLLLFSSLGVLVLLLGAAVEENFLRQWRRIQVSAEAATGDVRLRQVVVPATRTIDRCVSCHVGMAPGESPSGVTGMWAAHPPIPHDPGQFGCTVCHGGQGRATEKADAHGDVHFWPEPMIPLAYAEAGCGSCHAHRGVPDLAGLAQAERLFERFDCLACHRVDGRGGTLRPGGTGGMEGPDLSHVGAKGWQADWYEQHLQQARTAANGPWKDCFGELTDADRASIDTFLYTRVGASALVEAKALFHSLGCRGCHKIHGVGGDDGPDLTQFGLKDVHRLDFTHVPGEHTLANWLSEHFRAPAKVVTGSKMPAMGLTTEQIELLNLYMFSLRGSESLPGTLWPGDRLQVARFGEREFASDGRTLYGTFCAACHGPDGEGRRYPDADPFPAVANPDFLAVASDAFLMETLQRGRPGRRMPAWDEDSGGLRPDELRKIIGHLRELGGVAEPAADARPPRWVQGDAAAGEKRFTALCAGCHGTQGEGLQAPALRNAGLLAAASDTYLVDTIRRGRAGTPMPGFEQGSTTYPALAEEDIHAIVAFIRTWKENGP